MKKLNSCVLFLVLVVTCVNASFAANTPNRYPKSKTGIVKYEVYGATIAGTEILYYDDWGSREAKYITTTMELGGLSVTRNTLVLLEENGQWINNVDLNARTGIRMRNPRYKESIGLSRREREKNEEDKNIDAGGMKVEIERVIGKPCVVWEKQNTGIKTCTWNGIVLKKISDHGFSKTTTVATEIDEHVSIPEEKFTIPPDIEMKTVDITTFHGN
ncbi:MAG: hypothetical protein R2568_04810 [Candidatus Scalindua sp.]|jgi:hypothetical protein|nr:hypothetical protein [Candidatus Scalindua sp.]MDV5166051.1 hypothetical protein [Candidatus Scalindua sp.]